MHLKASDLCANDQPYMKNGNRQPEMNGLRDSPINITNHKLNRLLPNDNLGGASDNSRSCQRNVIVFAPFCSASAFTRPNDSGSVLTKSLCFACGAVADVGEGGVGTGDCRCRRNVDGRWSSLGRPIGGEAGVEASDIFQHERDFQVNIDLPLTGPESPSPNRLERLR